MRPITLLHQEDHRLNMYKTIFIVTFVLFIQACATGHTNTTKPSATHKAALTSILDFEGLDAFTKTLHHIVKERSQNSKQTQHFYVSKYPEATKQTYMFWPEEKLLWIMHLGADDEDSWLGVRYPNSGQLIDLSTSVVDTQQEVGSSSYLVTKEWASKHVFDAIINGDLIVINKD